MEGHGEGAQVIYMRYCRYIKLTFFGAPLAYYKEQFGEITIVKKAEASVIISGAKAEIGFVMSYKSSHKLM